MKNIVKRILCSAMVAVSAVFAGAFVSAEPTAPEKGIALISIDWSDRTKIEEGGTYKFRIGVNDDIKVRVKRVFCNLYECQKAVPYSSPGMDQARRGGMSGYRIKETSPDTLYAVLEYDINDKTPNYLSNILSLRKMAGLRMELESCGAGGLDAARRRRGYVMARVSPLSSFAGFNVRYYYDSANPFFAQELAMNYAHEAAMEAYDKTYAAAYKEYLELHS